LAAEFFEAPANGKGDFASSASILRTVSASDTVQDDFKEGVRVYGFWIPVNKGARVTVQLRTDKDLDTYLELHGPFRLPAGAGDKVPVTPGKRLEIADDSEDGAGAPAIEFVAPSTGNYLIAFTSFDDTQGQGYELALSCEGTAFQCRKPRAATPCEEGDLNVQGDIAENTTWSKCRVVMYEPVVVKEGAELVIAPGVEVLANYLKADKDDFFSRVGLTVEGAIDASGTEAHPIHFSSLMEDRGWNGITLVGDANRLDHVHVDRARRAVFVSRGAELSNLHLDGEGTRHLEKISSFGIETASFEDTPYLLTIRDSVVERFDYGISLRAGDSRLHGVTVREVDVTGIQIVGDQAKGSCDEGKPELSERLHRVSIEKSEVSRTGLAGTANAVHVFGSNIGLTMSRSVIHSNGQHGLFLSGHSAPEWQLRRNNFFGNGVAAVGYMHAAGALDVAENYWGHTVDPGLTEQWVDVCQDGGSIATERFLTDCDPSAGPNDVCGLDIASPNYVKPEQTDETKQ